MVIIITKEYGISELKELGLLNQVSYKLGPLDLVTRNVLDFKKLAVSPPLKLSF